MDEVFFGEYADKIPYNIKCGLTNYLVHRLAPGSFLSAVLKNDLRGAVQRADSEALLAIPAIVDFLVAVAPHGVWGSEEKVWAWVESRFYEKLGEVK